MLDIPHLVRKTRGAKVYRDGRPHSETESTAVNALCNV